MSSTVALADAAETKLSACRKLFSGGGFRSCVSPNICCRRDGLEAGLAEGGAGKSMTLFMEGGAFFLVAREMLLAALMEGKSEALFMDGGGAEPIARRGG